jgi:hypothetical protein
MLNYKEYIMRKFMFETLDYLRYLIAGALIGTVVAFTGIGLVTFLESL